MSLFKEAITNTKKYHDRIEQKIEEKKIEKEMQKYIEEQRKLQKIERLKKLEDKTYEKLKKLIITTIPQVSNRGDTCTGFSISRVTNDYDKVNINNIIVRLRNDEDFDGFEIYSNYTGVISFKWARKEDYEHLKKFEHYLYPPRDANEIFAIGESFTFI